MKKVGAAALAAAVVAAAAGAIAWGAGSDSPVVHACVAGGSGLVRIPGSGGCRQNETALDWNVQGPQGEPGPPGPAGPAGAAAGEPNTRVVGFLQARTAAGTIDGEATDKGHEKWITVLGFDGGAAAPVVSGGSGGAGAGKVDLKPIVITKPIDTATPKLFQALVTGEHLPGVQLDLVRPDGSGGEQVFYTVKLTNVLVGEIHQLDEGKADGRAVEQVSLDYQKIELVEGNGTAASGGPAG